MAIEAAFERSSYDEFVHDPINPTFKSSGHFSATALCVNSEIGVATSGENGPFIYGSNSDKLISIIES